MKYILLLLFTVNCLAQDVVVVKKGDVVPFDGVLFTKEKEKELRQTKLDLETSEKKVILLSDLNELNKKELDVVSKRLDLYQDKVREMADREVKSESRTFLQNSVYFISGALITGLIGYGIVKAYK